MSDGENVGNNPDNQDQNAVAAEAMRLAREVIGGKERKEQEKHPVSKHETWKQFSTRPDQDINIVQDERTLHAQICADVTEALGNDVGASMIRRAIRENVDDTIDEAAQRGQDMLNDSPELAEKYPVPLTGDFNDKHVYKNVRRLKDWFEELGSDEPTQDAENTFQLGIATVAGLKVLEAFDRNGDIDAGKFNQYLTVATEATYRSLDALIAQKASASSREKDNALVAGAIVHARNLMDQQTLAAIDAMGAVGIEQETATDELELLSDNLEENTKKINEADKKWGLVPKKIEEENEDEELSRFARGKEWLSKASRGSKILYGLGIGAVAGATFGILPIPHDLKFAAVPAGASIAYLRGRPGAFKDKIQSLVRDRKQTELQMHRLGVAKQLYEKLAQKDESKVPEKDEVQLAYDEAAQNGGDFIANLDSVLRHGVKLDDKSDKIDNIINILEQGNLISIMPTENTDAARARAQRKQSEKERGRLDQQRKEERRAYNERKKLLRSKSITRALFAGAAAIAAVSIADGAVYGDSPSRTETAPTHQVDITDNPEEEQPGRVEVDTSRFGFDEETDQQEENSE